MIDPPVINLKEIILVFGYLVIGAVFGIGLIFSDEKEVILK